MIIRSPVPRPILALVVLLLGAASFFGGAAGAQTLSKTERRAYKAAFINVERGNWDAARRHRAQGRNPLVDKALRWYEMRRGGTEASFGEIAGFLRANPDWPDRRLIQHRAEEAMPDDMDPTAVVAWFIEFPPIGTDGRIALAQTQLRLGRTEAAVALLRETWRESGFGSRQEVDFLKSYGKYLRESDHIARLDRLLWTGSENGAKRVMKYVSEDRRRLARARMTLRGMGPGVDRDIERVPAALQSDPGLIYERVRWRRGKNLMEDARSLLFDLPDTVPRPDLWWAERHILIRDALSSGHISAAYRLAKEHRQVDGAGLAGAEWLAGWIALRFLDERQTAFGHFKRMYDSCRTPVSKARGAYWMGRAAEAARRAEGATEAYRTAAQFKTTFYGQLASHKLGLADGKAQPAGPAIDAQTRARFDGQELAQLTRLMAEIGAQDLAAPFLAALANDESNPAAASLAASLAHEIGRPDLAVRVARSARRDGDILVDLGYPIRNLPAGAGPEPALVLSMIRQESGFDHQAISRAGGRGMMQLMPGTAKKMADQTGLNYSSGRLTSDPDYNIQLGRGYLAEMLQGFGGSYVLAVAAYNAGPGRVRQWVRELGDPRDRRIDTIDWIETIPFSETRNYVQRVLEALQIYRIRLNGPGTAMGLEKDLALTPSPDATQLGNRAAK
jgi:soluble lytic murein transglycosylase